MPHLTSALRRYVHHVVRIQAISPIGKGWPPLMAWTSRVLLSDLGATNHYPDQPGTPTT
jgi:hypothetical protein